MTSFFGRCHNSVHSRKNLKRLLCYHHWWQAIRNHLTFTGCATMSRMFWLLQSKDIQWERLVRQTGSVASLHTSFIGVCRAQEEVSCVWQRRMLTPWLCVQGSGPALGPSFHLFKAKVEQEALGLFQDLCSPVTLTALGWGSKSIPPLSLCYLWLRSLACQFESHFSHSGPLSRKFFSVKKALVLLSHSDTFHLLIKRVQSVSER